MGHFRKKVTANAEQWFKNGDHSEDKTQKYIGTDGRECLTEGQIVRHYHKPDNFRCPTCGRLTEDHGWLATKEIRPEGVHYAGNMVCPGDWIATDSQGLRYLVKEAEFKNLYDPIEKLG